MLCVNAITDHAHSKKTKHDIQVIRAPFFFCLFVLKNTRSFRKKVFDHGEYIEVVYMVISPDIIFPNNAKIVTIM